MSGLSINSIVDVNINLQSTSTGRRNFGLPLFVGTSDVIPVQTRIKSYSNISDIAKEFGVESDEYKAASLYFSQSPRPQLLQIGRWLKNASPAQLIGITLQTGSDQWKQITDGAFVISVGGSEKTITGLDFSDVHNMMAVASVINEKGETNGFGCVFDSASHRFIFSTLATGDSANIGYVSSGSTGTDISSKLGATEQQMPTIANGHDAETALECANLMMDISNKWYFLMFTSAELTASDHLAIANIIEASTVTRLYFYTTQDEECLDPADVTNIGYKLKQGNYNRTCGIYSSNSPFAAASFIGRAATLNFSGLNTMITMKFKQFIGVAPEELSETEARALSQFNINVFVLYSNDSAIIQEGVMASGWFFDEIFGLDWVQNALETSYFNMLYSNNKVPQTDSGMTLLINACESVCEEAVRNGLIAPGTWKSDGFGQLKYGDFLAKGYYFYCESFANQDQVEREQRKAMPIMGAIKLAGAIHFGDVIINVNR